LLSSIEILNPNCGKPSKSNPFSHEILTNDPSFEVMMLPLGLGGRPAVIKVSGEKEE
jgi:hypothetical protein